MHLDDTVHVFRDGADQPHLDWHGIRARSSDEADGAGSSCLQGFIRPRLH